MIAGAMDATSALLWLSLALLVAGGGTAWCLLSPTAKRSRQQRRLHDQLATANGLGGEETDALWRLARAAKLAEPAVAFVRPSLLDNGGAEGIGSAVLAALRSKLFGR